MNRVHKEWNFQQGANLSERLAVLGMLAALVNHITCGGFKIS
jgi:hypothetical protein